MADAAQLKLQVGLDLAFFRQQLAQIGTVAVGYQMPINIKFDRESIQRELARLSRLKTVISINDSQVTAATDRVDSLNKAIVALRNAAKNPIIVETKYKATGDVPGARTKAKSAVNTAVKGQSLVDNANRTELQSLYKFAKESNLQFEKLQRGAASKTEELRRVLGPAFSNVGSDILAGIKSGLADANSALSKIAAGMGTTLIGKTKAVFGIASPSRVFKAIGQNIVDGLEIGLQDFNALKTKMIGEMREFAAAMKREAKIGAIGIGGLLSPIARPQGAATKTIPGAPSLADGVSLDPGRGNQKILNSLSLLTGDPALYRKRMSSVGAERLPSSLLGAAQSQFSLENLAPSFKQARLASKVSPLDKIIDEAFFGRGALPKAQSALSSLSNSLERLGNATRAAMPSGILQNVSGNARMRAFGGVDPSQTMGIFQPTGKIPTPAPGGSFLQFSQRATAVSAGSRQAQASPIAAGGGNQPPVPPVPPSGGRGGSSGFGGFANAMAGIKLPGAGVISELGGEFAMAAKQVLLFGTAYKALAFLTDFPGKVGDAVGQLQTFRNTLKSITPSGEEFRTSNKFILDTVDKYNVPLQSARQGFTSLYASMAPAGFKGDEIRNIFSGISQGAATFGMSAEKVDRVTYAFAQMASKGQVMAEEVKGQLGDVMPGAVAIFAEAAGFKGPEAMTKFTKAMEAGAYKGAAMKQLLVNVGMVMKKEFGPGAEGAARTFQGLMNRMQNATLQLYETFEPMAIGFANKVVLPMTSGLKIVADGFNAFFTGTAAKTGGGFAISQELERLKPTLEGLRANLAGLVPSFQLFGSLLLNVAKALAVVAGNPITGFLLKVYANVLLVNTAFTLLGGRVLVGLITNIGLATSRLFAMQVAFFSLQRTSAVTNSTLAGTQLQMMLLQRNAAGVVGPVNLLLGSLLRMAAIGAIAIAITIAITNANELRDAELRVARLRGERDPVGPEGPKPVMTPARRFTGASRETVQGARAAQAPLVIQYRKELKVLQQQLLTAKAITASSEDNAQASVANVQAKTAQARVDAKVLDIQNAQGILNLNPGSFKTVKEQQTSLLKLPPIPGAGDDPKAAKAAAAALASRQALADKLSADQTKTDIERQKTLFENTKSMINMEYDLREARANSFQKETIRFQKELFNIEMERQKAVLDANNAITKAQGAVAGGPAPTSGFIDKSVLQKWMESQGFGRTTGDFTNKGHATPNHMLNAMDMGIIGGSDADALRKTKAMEERLRRTGAFGNQLFGPTRDPMGHGAGRGGQNIHLHIPTPGGKVPMTPGLAAEMNYSGASSATSTGGKPSSHQKKVVLADQQTRNALQDRGVNLTLAEAEAHKKAEVAIAGYVASIVPVAEQELQNKILENRISLTQASTSPGLLSAQLAYSEQQLKTGAAIKVLTDDIAKMSQVKGKDGKITQEAQKQINGYKSAIDKLKGSLPISEVQQLTKSILEQAEAIISKAKIAEQARNNENRLNQLIISGLTQEQAEAKLAAEALERDYAPAVKIIDDNIKEYSSTLEKLNLQKAAGIALDKGQIEEYARLQKAIEDLEKAKAGGKNKKDEATSTPLPKEKTFKESITSEKAKISEQLKEMTKPANMLIGLAKQIGSSFSDAFVKVIDGTASAQEALAGFFKSIGDYLIQYGAQMLSLAIIKGILGLFGNGAAFDGGGITKNAKGNAFNGSGIAKFATGGIVNGPTLFPFADGGAMQMGLMGEAGPEAIMPLQRGADGSLGVRAAMGGNGMGGSSSPILNMNFETSTINGVEYVSRDQLEAAMMQTRRQASSDGAKRGMTMTLDKIQQSPQTRRRIGM